MSAIKAPTETVGTRLPVGAVELDVSDAYNRIADTWCVVFGPASQPSMPIAACAYPINMGEHMIAAIRDRVLSEDHCLRWPMQTSASSSMPAVAYRLFCNWQGRALQHPSGEFGFIENAVGWVDWDGDADTTELVVKVAFGRPQFVDGIATMRVEFDVNECSADGSPIRHSRHPFRISADGGCEPQR
jgi:hypothetical protein